MYIYRCYELLITTTMFQIMALQNTRQLRYAFSTLILKCSRHNDSLSLLMSSQFP